MEKGEKIMEKGETVRTILFVAGMILIAPVLISAEVIHVPQDYTTVQDGLNAATAGDTVLVAPGTFTENIIWPQTDEVTLLSEQGADHSALSGGTAGRVILIWEIAAAVINGFTIRDGIAAAEQNGGGIYGYNTNLNLCNCVISENFGGNSWGGAGALFAGGAPVISDNVFTSNEAQQSSVGSALALQDSGALVTRNMFTLNSDPEHSGALSVEYGSVQITRNTFISNPTSGILLWEGSGDIRDNIFINNVPDGIMNDKSGWVHIENNLFYGNPENGIRFSNADTHNHIIGNTIIGSAHGIKISYSDGPLEVNNNIVTGCSEGISINQDEPVGINNNDVWNNTTNYTGIDDPTGSDGNISLDPLFCTCPFGEFFLSQTAAGQSEDSPCVDAGNEPAPGATLTTRTDLAPDTGIRDLGFHYATDAATVTPTATPSQPPMPTTTPSPEPSATPSSSQLGIQIHLNMEYFTPGDHFDLNLEEHNPGPATAVDVFLLLDIFGNFLFWPSWSESLDFETRYLPGNSFQIWHLLAFTWPDNVGAVSNLIFWAAFLTPGSWELISLDYQDFSYGE
jgi:nitrous oxidase accessory protein NosD